MDYAEYTIKVLSWWAENNKELRPYGYSVLPDVTGEKDYKIISKAGYG